MTIIAVDRTAIGHRLQHSEGLLRAVRLHGPEEVCRVGLVATTALLLAGDRVELDVRVGPGARLQLSDIAATVAYHGRGVGAEWHTRVRVADGGCLVYHGEPLVVTDGAAVERSLRVDLAGDARVWLRETVILGRENEVGGWLRSQTRIRRDGAELIVEDQVLDPTTRRRPGMLGTLRVLDTLVAIGLEPPPLPGAVTYRLAEERGAVVRFLGDSLAASPIPGDRGWPAALVVPPEH